VPWPLGPPDGRYLLRREGEAADAAPAHVLVIATLGAAVRRRSRPLRRQANAQPEPEPARVATGRATLIDVSGPLGSAEAAEQWLRGAGEPELERGLAIVNRALHAFRLVSADPYLNPLGRAQALVARIGFGAGEQVADGQWTAARELELHQPRQRRARILAPQARLAAILGGRERALACEELALRARLDLDQGRPRVAALQLLVALDAALSELPADPTAAVLADRLTELREQRETVREAAQAALARELDETESAAVAFTLERIEAALRARAVANA
jgi:hypothetical protein